MESALPGLLVVIGRHLFQEYTIEQLSYAFRRVGSVAGMGVLGAVTTCGDIRALVLPLFLFYLWGKSSSRHDAGRRAFFFFLGATWILPEAIVTFYEALSLRIPLAIALYIGGCFLLSLPFGALWSKQPLRRGVAVPMIIATLTLPPLGVLSVVNPLVSAGFVFPGAGMWGVGGVVVVASVLAMHKRAIVLMAPILAVTVFTHPGAVEKKGGRFLVDHDTHFSMETGEVRPDAEFARAFVVEREAKNVRERVVLLPESIGGQVTETSAFLWDRVRRRIGAKALVIGGERGFSTHWENGLYLIDGGGAAKKLYTQRIPVPVTMWKPWKGEFSYPLNVSSTGTFDLYGRRIGALICYESLLAFPVLQMFWQSEKKIEEVAVIGNLWWAKRTHLARIIEQYAEAWGRAFGVRVVVSLNG
jgi:hypothetical protein